jgi:TetR/AcrR family transcriptional repressor of nem operon
MTPGPPKRFDTDVALVQARDVFWRRGYDGTSLSELESVLGIGRKSLYDTFGSKRELFLRSLELYTDTVIQQICDGLDDPRNGPMENLERVLVRLQQHHGSPDSLGCMLGVAMAQADSGDPELAALLSGYLRRLELAYLRTIKSAQSEGTADADARPRDVARNLVALTQGMALMGRIADVPTQQRSIVRAALHGLRP